MNINIKRILVCSGLLFLVNYQLNAFDSDQLFKSVTNLVDRLTKVSEQTNTILDNMTQVKMFSTCARAKDKSAAMVVNTKRPDLKVTCKDLQVPLRSIQNLIIYFESILIGSEKEPGLLLEIYKLFNLIGVESQEQKLEQELLAFAEKLKCVERAVKYLEAHIRVMK